jgi:hypothetical protein
VNQTSLTGATLQAFVVFELVAVALEEVTHTFPPAGMIIGCAVMQLLLAG